MTGRLVAAAAALAALACGQARRSFDVASVKPHINCEAGSGRPAIAPGKLDLQCVSLRALIRIAYGGMLAGGSIAARQLEVLGGPGWLDGDRYDVSAKAEGRPSIDETVGTMLQVLLEERFQVKVHKEPRDTAVYLLTVARDGPKLQPAKEGSCVPFDLGNLGPPKPGEPMPKYCGAPSGRIGKGGFKMSDSYGITMAEFAARLVSSEVDREVVDRTGLTGRFDVHIEFVPDPSMWGPATANGVPLPSPAASDNPGPNIFAALQAQLGLKLTPGKAPLDVIVVDHAEKPSAN